MTKKENTNYFDSVEDSIFRLAVYGAAQAEGEALHLQEQDSADKYGPSEPNVENFNKLLRRKKAHSFRSFVVNRSRRAVIACLLTICLIGAIGSVSAFRIEIMNILMQLHDDYAAFQISDDSTQNKAIINWTNTYIPTYIPNGYEINDLSVGKTYKTIVFTNPEIENGYIGYMEMDSSHNLTIDTEEASRIDTIKIHGEEGMLVVKDGLTSIVWKENAVMFLIQATVEPDEALKIAEGVKFMK